MASPMRAVAEVLSQLMHPNRAADIIRMADADPAFAAKLMEAVQADDFGRSLRMLVADAQWGRSPAAVVDAVPAPEVMTTAQRMMRDPNIRPAIDANVDRLPPELAERIAADDPDAFMEAFQMIAEAEGELPLRTLDTVPPPATRQMELPMGGDNEPPSRGLIPFGVRGEGVPVGGPTGMGTLVGEPVSAGVPIYPMSNFERALANPARQRWEGFGFPSQYRPGPARIGTTAGSRVSGPPPERGLIPHPSMGGPRDMIVRQPERMSLGDIAAAGIAGAAAGGGGFLMGRGIGEELFNQDAAPETQVMGDDDLTPGDTAALAAETNPPPAVSATQDDDFSRIREMQGFVQEQNSDMEELKALKYKQDRTPEETQYLRMMKVPIPGDWRRVVDAGHIPLGEPTPEESAAADERIRNMVRMGATWDEARTRAYDDVAKKVIARTRQKAEAFLRANPDF